MLYGDETWALTGKLEDILKSCDSRMLTYIARVRGQDRITKMMMMMIMYLRQFYDI